MSGEIRLSEEHLKKILEINKRINTLINLSEVLEKIMEGAIEIIGTEGGSLLLVDWENKKLKFAVVKGVAAERLINVSMPLDKGIAGHVVMTGESVLTNDVQQHPKFFPEIDKITGLQTKSLIAVPLKRGKNIVGVLEVINPIKKPNFEEVDKILLEQFAEQAAIAITNAILYKKLKDKTKELTYLFEISRATNITLDRKELFNYIVNVLSEMLNSERISIMLVDTKTETLYIEASKGIGENVVKNVRVPLDSDRVCAYVFRNAESVLVKDMEKDRRFGRNKKLRYRTKSFLSVPIISQGKPVGVVNVTERTDNTPYTEEDLGMLEIVAPQIGHIYESVLHYEETLERQVLETELKAMQKVQEGFILKEIPKIDNLDIAFKIVPSRYVGGDFYDVYELGEGKYGFVIGDVSGKGLPAALFMAASKSTLRAYAYIKESPKETLEIANKLLYKDSITAMFVTAFYLVIDVPKKQIIYSNAGHNHQFIIKGKEGKVIKLTTKGLPLAVEEDSVYENASMELESGDLIVLYTDGITESRNIIGEEFGEERLIEILKKHKDMPAKAIINIVFSEIDAFLSNIGNEDDMAIGIIKVL